MINITNDDDPNNRMHGYVCDRLKECTDSVINDLDPTDLIIIMRKNGYKYLRYPTLDSNHFLEILAFVLEELNNRFREIQAPWHIRLKILLLIGIINIINFF